MFLVPRDPPITARFTWSLQPLVEKIWHPTSLLMVHGPDVSTGGFSAKISASHCFFFGTLLAFRGNLIKSYPLPYICIVLGGTKKKKTYKVYSCSYGFKLLASLTQMQDFMQLYWVITLSHSLTQKTCWSVYITTMDLKWAFSSLMW